MSRRKNILGWIGVSITVALAGLWAYWGATENFHEGWYSVSLWENIGMMVLQYLLFTFIFMALGLISIRWRIPGLILHIALGVFCIFFFGGASFSVVGLLIVIPLAGLGLLHFFGEPRPRKWACLAIVLVPLVIITAISIPMGIKVSRRIDDGDRSLQVVEGNGVTLCWAPRGPGWPDRGATWDEAAEICRYLSEDGLAVMEKPQDIWRLPTVDEAVRSMMLHGEIAGGEWDPEAGQARYTLTPDKESPLWDAHSPVIYYWTADSPAVSADGIERAYIIVYHGGIFTKRKTDGQAYLSFRAVKDGP